MLKWTLCDIMATGLSPSTMTFEEWATHYGIDEQTSKILIENGINSISCVKLLTIELIQGSKHFKSISLGQSLL